VSGRWIAMAAACSLAGCSVPIARFGAVGLDNPTRGAAAAPSSGAVIGSSCRWWVLGVPFGLPHVDEAVADALRGSGATLLRDAELRSVHPIYGPVGRHCYTITGTPVSGFVTRSGRQVELPPLARGSQQRP
jgi:hypothetical protein